MITVIIIILSAKHKTLDKGLCKALWKLFSTKQKFKKNVYRKRFIYPFPYLTTDSFRTAKTEADFRFQNVLVQSKINRILHNDVHEISRQKSDKLKIKKAFLRRFYQGTKPCNIISRLKTNEFWISWIGIPRQYSLVSKTKKKNIWKIENRLNLKVSSKKLVGNDTVTCHFTAILHDIQVKEKTISIIVELKFQNKMILHEKSV